jgi:hypothetical protein
MLPSESTTSSPEKIHRNQLMPGTRSCSGNRYAIHLRTTSSGDGSTLSLIQPILAPACHSAMTSTGTTSPTPISCQFAFAIASLRSSKLTQT